MTLMKQKKLLISNRIDFKTYSASVKYICHLLATKLKDWCIQRDQYQMAKVT